MQTFLQIFYFYNPLLWFSNIIVRRIREQAVDETVLVYLGDKADTYSRTLVDIAEIAFAKPSLGLNMIGVVESKKALTGRIKHILSRPFPKTVKLGIAGLLTIILAALVLIPMARGYDITDLGGLYEKAIVSRDFKVKAGPTDFSANVIVRWNRNGSPIITDPKNEAMLNVPYKIPDYTRQAAWMDIAQVYISPGIEKYEAIELRVFDHEKREILSYEDYIGIGYNIRNSVATIYSIGQLLPNQIDLWMRVIHKPEGTIVTKIPAQENAVVNLPDNTLKILEIKKGTYSYTSNQAGINWTKHNSEDDEEATSVAFQFNTDNNNRRKFQVCAVSKDGQRYVPDYPHFISSTNGRHHVIVIGFPKEQIDYFEITPFVSRDTFYFDGIKLPKVSDSFAPCPEVTFDIKGSEGEFTSNTLLPVGLKLFAFNNKIITGISGGADNWRNTFSTPKAQEGASGFALKINGIRTKNFHLFYLDQSGKRIDPKSPREHPWASGGSTTIIADSFRVPLEQINSVVFIISTKDENELQTERQRTNKFKTNLPHGGTIELVGVCKKNQPDQPWYSPDGRQKLGTSDEIFSHLSGTTGIVNAAGTQTYEFFIHCDLPSNKIDKVVKNKWSFEPVKGIPGAFSTGMSRGQHYFTASIGFPETLEKLDLTFDVSNGQWETIAENVGDNVKEVEITHRGQKQTITLGEIVEKDGSLVIEVKHQIKEMAARIVVFDKYGKVRYPVDNMLDYADPNRNVFVTKCQFDGMKKDDIDRYEFQIQPIDIVTFKDVSLKDGYYSNPKTSVDSITDETPITKAMPKEIEKSNAFSAKLPNGVTVDLLGVCEYPSEGKQWWKPDGNALSRAPYLTTGNRITDEKTGYKYYEFALKLTPTDASYFWMIPGSDHGGDTGSPYDEKGRQIQEIKAYTTSLPEEQKSVNVLIGVTAADWQTAVTYKPEDLEETYSVGEYTIAFGIAYMQDNRTLLPVVHNYNRKERLYAIRVIAITKSGQIYTSGYSGSGGNQLNSLTYIFNGLSLENIKEFQFQTRPYKWVAFKNVSLEPGEKTDVQIKLNTSDTNSSTEIRPVGLSNVTPPVWITFVPASTIRSMTDYQHSQKVESLSSEKVKICELEIRSASDNKRVARFTYDNYPISGRRWGCKLNKQQIQEIGAVKDGTYLAAFYVNGIRCSNVAQFTIDSNADLNSEPTLKLVPLPLDVGQVLPNLGIIATGPSPADPELEYSTIAFPELFVDGIERKIKVMKWAGPDGILQTNAQAAMILDLENYTPAIAMNQPHEVWAKSGKYQSATVIIPESDTAEKNWDEISELSYLDEGKQSANELNDKETELYESILRKRYGDKKDVQETYYLSSLRYKDWEEGREKDFPDSFYQRISDLPVHFKKASEALYSSGGSLKYFKDPETGKRAYMAWIVINKWISDTEAEVEDGWWYHGLASTEATAIYIKVDGNWKVKKYLSVKKS